jgi:hypothetical protein
VNPHPTLRAIEILKTTVEYHDVVELIVPLAPFVEEFPCTPINPKEAGFFRKKFWRAPNAKKKIKILKFST